MFAPVAGASAPSLVLPLLAGVAVAFTLLVAGDAPASVAAQGSPRWVAPATHRLPVGQNGGCFMPGNAADTVLFFGGVSDVTVFDGFYRINVSSGAVSNVTVLNAGGSTPVDGVPEGRFAAACGTTASGLHVVSGGSTVNLVLFTTHVYDPVTQRWSGGPLRGGSAADARTSAASTVFEDTLLLFGGYDGSSAARGDLVALTPSTTANMTYTPIPTTGMTASSPSPRAGATMIPYRPDDFVVFGGVNSTSNYFNDVYLLHVAAGASSATWLLVSTGATNPIAGQPAPRFAPVAGYDANHFWIYGGSSSQADFRDLWTLDLSGASGAQNWTFVPLEAGEPDAGRRAGTAYLAASAVTYNGAPHILFAGGVPAGTTPAPPGGSPQMWFVSLDPPANPTPTGTTGTASTTIGDTTGSGTTRSSTPAQSPAARAHTPAAAACTFAAAAAAAATLALH